jgi:hypothetical protein
MRRREFITLLGGATIEPNTESEPSTIERAAAEPEHGTGQPDACDPEAFLALRSTSSFRRAR